MHMTPNWTTRHWLGRSLAVLAIAAFFAGCVDEAPLSPNRSSALQSTHTVSQSVAPNRTNNALELTSLASNDNRDPELGGCARLQVAEGSKLLLHAFAKGVQIYRWTGTSWTLVGPSAELFADAEWRGRIGSHYAGPTWESVSGSKVVGSVLDRCTANPNAIPWLLLQKVTAEGPGIFARVAFIQRLNTVGGNAPVDPGAVVGSVVNVPYTAEYFFYRAP